MLAFCFLVLGPSSRPERAGPARRRAKALGVSSVDLGLRARFLEAAGLESRLGLCCDLKEPVFGASAAGGRSNLERRLAELVKGGGEGGVLGLCLVAGARFLVCHCGEVCGDPGVVVMSRSAGADISKRLSQKIKVFGLTRGY